MNMDSLDRRGVAWVLWVLLLALATVSGCASNPGQATSNPGKSAAKDPIEAFNRPVFVFNDTLDGWVLKPVAQGYHMVTPDPLEQGVGNFFSNLSELPSALNNILQWKWKKAGGNTGRFLLNSTVGLAGLFDVARLTGLERKDYESFGQTLSYWGLGAGPYVVVPFWGPSTATDILAFPVEWYSDPLFYVDREAIQYSLRTLQRVDERSRLLAAEELISGDRYVFIREAFLQRREFLVNDGQVKDDFGGDFDDFDEDF